MERAGYAGPASVLHATGHQHHGRANRLIETALRAHNLDVVACHPLIIPYRGVFLAPYSDGLLDGLVFARDYFVRWRDGVVAAIPENQIEPLQQVAPHAVILFLEGDAMGEQMMRAQIAGENSIESAFEQRLLYAQTVSPVQVGEDFDAYATRLLLKQNALLRSLDSRLSAEAHDTAWRHCSPLLVENTAQLQAALAAQPENQSADPLADLESLEVYITAHAASWAGHCRDQDSAGLLFQFDGAGRTSSVSQQLIGLRQRG
jgi:hypothetical protein